MSSRTISNRSGENGHLCLVPNTSENVLSFVHLICCWLVVCMLHYVEVCSLCSLPFHDFYHEGCLWSFSKRKNRRCPCHLEVSHVSRTQDIESSYVISSQFCFNIELTNYSSDFLTPFLVFSISKFVWIESCYTMCFFFKSGFSPSVKCFWYGITHIIALKQNKEAKSTKGKELVVTSPNFLSFLL